MPDVFRRISRPSKSLKLRRTLGDLKYCPHPWRTLWAIIWPLPWKYRLPAPLDPLYIRDDPEIVHRRYYVEDNYRRLRGIPLFQLRDTPLRSLYRLHDVACANEENYIMLEGNYLWNQREWRIKDIPDPKDPDPLRYAILASLVEAIVEAFNWKISLGLRRGVRWASRETDEANRLETDKPFEEAPAWVLDVPAVEEWTSFVEGRKVIDTGPQFNKRRLSMEVDQLTNI